VRRFEATEEGGRQVVQAVDANCLHLSFFFLSARNAVMSPEGSGAAFFPLLSGAGAPAPVL
jgi:hypothetical protein